MFVKKMSLQTTIVLGLFCIASAFDCDHLLRQLADKQSILIQCITDYSVPVTMCTNCHQHYNHTLEAYDSLAANCSSSYFDKDRINLIPSTESMLTGLWSKAFCDDCYNNNNKKVFDDKYKNFNTCVVGAQKDNDACEKCKMTYMDLNNFYINLDQHNNGEVCYDLQDTMNRTRNTWSKELKCCRREHNMTLFSIALAIISCLPIIFYGSMYVITKHKERNHGVLSDDDPIYSSELPTSTRQYNVNDISEPSINNVPPTTTLKSVHKKETPDSESSDDDLIINTANYKILFDN